MFPIKILFCDLWGLIYPRPLRVSINIEYVTTDNARHFEVSGPRRGNEGGVIPKSAAGWISDAGVLLQDSRR